MICNIKLIDISYFIVQGVHIVVAAGGSNTDACSQTPAGVKECKILGFNYNYKEYVLTDIYSIAVGATDINDYCAVFSNYGDCVEIYAPVSRILNEVL